jgi:hypothetical protein
MLPTVRERLTLKARLVFDVVDRFARDRGTQGAQTGPLGALRFFLIGKMNGPVREDFVPPWELVVRRNAGGYYLFFGQVLLPGGKSPLRMRFAAGQYFVRIDSDYYQRAEPATKLVAMPDVDSPDSPPPYVVLLEPSYAYPFPATVPVRLGAAAPTLGSGQPGPTLIRGSLHKQNKEAIAGATVEVVGQSNKYVTDESGQWVILFEQNNLQSGLVTVQIAIPNGNVIQVQNVRVIKGCETSLPEDLIIGLP